jgi:teichuronic acid biosynthesis glycosyltransferase TuaC
MFLVASSPLYDQGPAEMRTYSTNEEESSNAKILLICDFAPGLLSNALSWYSLTKNEVTLVGRGKARAGLPTNVRVVTLPLRVIGLSGKESIRGYMRLFVNTVSYVFTGSVLALIAALKSRCTVVHARFIFPEGIVGLVTSSLLRSKLIITAEGTDANLYLNNKLLRGLLPVLARKAQFIAVSRPIQTRLSSFGVRAVYLPNSVDCFLFKFVPLRSKQKIIVFVGSLTWVKRPQFLLNGLSKIHDFLVESRIKVLIVGDGPLRTALERQIQDQRLEDIVDLEGYRPRDYVVDLLSRASVYVSCSTMEGMSLAMLEAMASGPVVIASDIPATCALITDGETGFTFPVDDVDALARTIKFVFEQAAGRVNL